MYAVIRTGGKQERVAEGQELRVELLGEELGPKIRGFTYKNKSNQSTRWGHRQRYSTIAITGISAG